MRSRAALKSGDARADCRAVEAWETPSAAWTPPDESLSPSPVATWPPPGAGAPAAPWMPPGVGAPVAAWMSPAVAPAPAGATWAPPGFVPAAVPVDPDELLASQAARDRLKKQSETWLFVALLGILGLICAPLVGTALQLSAVFWLAPLFLAAIPVGLVCCFCFGLAAQRHGKSMPIPIAAPPAPRTAWSDAELHSIEEARSRLRSRASVAALIGLLCLAATVLSFALIPSGGMVFFGGILSGPLMGMDARRKLRKLDSIEPGTALDAKILGIRTSIGAPRMSNRIAVAVLATLIALVVFLTIAFNAGA